MAPDALGGRVEVRWPHAEAALDPLPKRGGERLAVRRHPLQPQAKPPGELLFGKQARGGGVHVHEVRLERVERGDELVERARSRRATAACALPTPRLRAPRLLMCVGAPPPTIASRVRGSARLQPHPVAAAQEHRENAAPAAHGHRRRRPCGQTIHSRSSPGTRRGRACPRGSDRGARAARPGAGGGRSPASSKRSISSTLVRTGSALSSTRPLGSRSRQNGECRGRVPGELRESLVLEALEPLARPALTLAERPALAYAAREVLKARHPVAHRVLLRSLRVATSARRGPRPRGRAESCARAEGR